MSKHFVQNELLRSSLLASYRLYARAQVWRSGPRIFINSIPKAGTHLLTAELERMPRLQNSRLHIKAHEVNAASTGARILKYQLDAARVARLVSTVRGHQFFTGHLFWFQDLDDLFHKEDVRTLFVVRDPRDILVSMFHYIMGLRRHHLHELFTQHLQDDEARFRALILGSYETPGIRPFRETLSSFAPWTRSPTAITLRFEDLVGERGGGSAEAKLEALARIKHHIGLEEAGDLQHLANSAPAATPTLRSGKSNAWRESLPPEVHQLVLGECGDLIAAMGYEVG